MKTLLRANKIYRIFARTVKILTASVAGIFVLAFLALQIPQVQNYLGQELVAFLSNEIDSEVTVEEIRFNFHEIDAQHIRIKDQENDSLFSATSLEISFDLLPILSKRISINTVELNGATINARRSTGENDFNYQFLIDYFSASEDTTNTSSAFEFSIDEIILNNSIITQRDQVADESIHLNVNKLGISIDKIDTENQRFVISSLMLDNSDLKYKYNSSIEGPTTENTATATTPASISFPNPVGWDLILHNLDISNTDMVFSDKIAKTTPGIVNFNDLGITNFNFNASNLNLLTDTAFGQIGNIAFEEKSGFRIDTFTTSLSLANNMISLDDLIIETQNSKITRNFEFEFDQISDFNDFVNKVKFDLTFDESVIAGKDITFFVNDPNIPTETYHLDGNFSGKVSNLKGKDVILQYSDHTRFLGNFSLMGLPDLESTFIDFSIDQFTTNREELNDLLPFANIPRNTRKLGVVNFNGSFTGFINDFVAYGELKTALGYLESDINMKIPKQGKPSYSGKLIVENFDVGRYVEDPMLGRVSFNGKVSGQSFDLDSIQANAEGVISKLVYNNYKYTDIKFKGQLEKRFFSGDLNVKDQNIVMDFHGTVDLKSEVPEFSMKADIGHFDTKPLGLTDKSIKIKTVLDANFRGINIDDLVGSLQLKHTAVYANNSFYNIGEVSINAENYSLGKRMVLESSMVDARLDGKFDISKLPSTFLGFASNYYPSILNYTKANVSGQDFLFNIEIKKTNNITDLVFQDIEGLEGASISGNFNSTYSRLILNAEIPKLGYNDINANGITANLNSTDDTLYFDIDVGDLAITPEFHATHRMSGKIANNKVYMHLEVYEDSLVNNLLANAEITNVGDSIQVKLLNSSLEIANQEWNIKSSNVLYFYQDLIYAKDLEFTSGDQKIVVESVESVKNKEKLSGLRADFSEVQLNQIMEILSFKDYELAGGINGYVTFYDIFNFSRSLESDLEVRQFSIDKDTFGTLSAKVDLPFNNMIMQAEAKLDSKVGLFDANGSYNLKSDALDFNVKAENTPLKIMEPFMTGILSGMKGRIDGAVTLTGTTKDPNMQGRFTINNAESTLEYLKARYYFEPLEIDFNNNSIYIKETKFRDGTSANASTADIGGEIFVESFNDIEFRDFYVHTDKNFKFMETTKADNDLFYGDAYGKGIVLINGPLSRLDVYINAVSDPGTDVSIPIMYETGVAKYNFVTFVDRDSLGNRKSKTTDEVSYSSVNFTMDLEITPDAQVQLIFDEQAGDIIRGRGKGNLKMNFNSDNEFEMYGNLTITEGDYLFTLKDVISKKFVIQEGGTITWTGDPYEAMLDITADYTKKVSAYNLVSFMEEELTPSELQEVKEPSPYTVELSMTGSLSNPDIKFGIQSEEETAGLSTIVQSRLREIENDQNELNKQVFGLIVFNSFLPAQLGSSQGNTSLLSSGVGTVTEFVSNQLSIYFNDWLSQYNLEVDFAYRNYEVGQSSEAQGVMRNELELELRKKIGRLAINVGGNYDFGNTNSNISNANNLAGDFSVEYSLTEDGRLRVRAFRESDYDLFSDAYRNKGGIGLYYRKEFNSFKELFQSPESSKEAPAGEETEESEKQLEAVDEPTSSNED